MGLSMEISAIGGYKNRCEIIFIGLMPIPLGGKNVQVQEMFYRGRWTQGCVVVKPLFVMAECEHAERAFLRFEMFDGFRGFEAVNRIVLNRVTKPDCKKK